MDTLSSVFAPRTYSVGHLLIVAGVWCVVMGLLATRILRACDQADGSAPDSTPSDPAP